MGYEHCVNCHQDWSVRYNAKGYTVPTDPYPEINWLAMYNDKFYVELDFNDEQTRIFSWIPKDNKYIPLIHFNRLEKINPTTVKPWLDRILKLKYFY